MQATFHIDSLQALLKQNGSKRRSGSVEGFFWLVLSHCCWPLNQFDQFYFQHMCQLPDNYSAAGLLLHSQLPLTDEEFIPDRTL